MSHSLSVATTGPQTLTGVIQKRNDDGVFFRHKKPRSSKFIERFIPWSQILVLAGNDGEDESELVMMGQTDCFDADVEVKTPKGIDVPSGMTAFTSSDWGTIMVRSGSDVVVSRETDGEVSKGKKAKPKTEKAEKSAETKKSGKKSKGKKIKPSWD